MGLKRRNWAAWFSREKCTEQQKSGKADPREHGSKNWSHWEAGQAGGRQPAEGNLPAFVERELRGVEQTVKSGTSNRGEQEQAEGTPVSRQLIQRAEEEHGAVEGATANCLGSIYQQIGGL